MTNSPILVTGSAGRIGQAVVRELVARGRVVRGFDVAPTPGASESLVGDIASAEPVSRAMEGVGVLIHLAATPDEDDFLTKLLPNNLVGTFHVVEAARRGETRLRVILASTGQVVWWQRMRGELPIDANAAPTPRGWYAATKCFLEAAGRSLAEADGREVIAVRLGWCPRTTEQAREIAVTDWAQDVYLSPGDAGRFFASAALTPKKWSYAVVYASSRPKHRLTYDLGSAKELLGFEPADVWPEGVEEMLAASGGS